MRVGKQTAPGKKKKIKNQVFQRSSPECFELLEYTGTQCDLATQKKSGLDRYDTSFFVSLFRVYTILCQGDFRKEAGYYRLESA